MAETKAKAAEKPDINEQLLSRIAELEKKIGEQQNALAPTKESDEIESIKRGEQIMQELVEIRLFKDNDKYKDDVFVAVNGKSYLIKRGETVKVPRYVKEVLDNSTRQDEYAAKYAEGMADKYKAESKGK
jgi:hypothetical protein